MRPRQVPRPANARAIEDRIKQKHRPSTAVARPKGPEAGAEAGRMSWAHRQRHVADRRTLLFCFYHRTTIVYSPNIRWSDLAVASLFGGRIAFAFLRFAFGSVRSKKTLPTS
eukprot:483941-Prymnesium_polylepis.1